MLFKCPECGCTDVTVEVKTWCRFDCTTNDDGTDFTEERSFDCEDTEYVDVVDDGAAICHQCQHQWKHGEVRGSVMTTYKCLVVRYATDIVELKVTADTFEQAKEDAIEAAKASDYVKIGETRWELEDIEEVSPC